MREKVSTAYFLDDPRKFSSMEEAEKELNRLRAVCVRLKKKQGEDIAFMLGLSVTDSQYMGKMGYQKSMRYGGKKVFICSERRIHNGERVEPCTDKPPHIHIMVQGYGASTAAERIIQSVRKGNPDCKCHKQHLKTAEQTAQAAAIYRGAKLCFAAGLKSAFVRFHDAFDNRKALIHKGLRVVKGRFSFVM